MREGGGGLKRDKHNFVTTGLKKRNKSITDFTYKRFVFNVALSVFVCRRKWLYKLYKTLGKLCSDGTNDWLGEGQCAECFEVQCNG